MTTRRRPWFHTDGRRLYITVPLFGRWRLGRSFTLRKKNR